MIPAQCCFPPTNCRTIRNSASLSPPAMSRSARARALCRDDPTRAPVWQLRAEQIVHDQQRHIVEYRDATLELGGVPVLYLPYLAHPDPSVKRQSGLMAPTFGNSTNLGAHATVPYYWAIGPDRDATFSPTFTTAAGQVLAGQYRQRFSNGEMQGTGSINWDSTGNAAP